ncbi:MAG: Xaa-Pro peptidase family protein [Acetobacteraceae bacterium]
MSRHDFPPEEFAARQARVREAIGAAGLDWLIVIHPMSLHWLIGTEAKSYQAFQCLLLSARPGPLVVLTRLSERCEFVEDSLADEVIGWGGPEPQDPIEAFAAVAERFGLRQARVGLETPPYYLHPHQYLRLRDMLGTALVAEPASLIAELKQVKSPREIELVRTSARIADTAMAACIGAVAEDRSELEIAAAIYHSLLSQGSSLPSSAINLVTGERSGFAHGAPTLRRMRRGDAGNVEFGAAYRRYTKTIGRQFSLGPPSPRLRDIYDVVRAAFDACLAEIRDGVPAIVPHEAACRVIAQAGMDRYRLHTTGYSIGAGVPPSWGEPLNMFGGSKDVLRAGMVVSIEPPVFIAEERIGARIIDNVLVTATGAELLSQTTLDLIVVG